MTTLVFLPCCPYDIKTQDIIECDQAPNEPSLLVRGRTRYIGGLLFEVIGGSMRQYTLKFPRGGKETVSRLIVIDAPGVALRGYHDGQFLRAEIGGE